jgi:thiamine pyrophosphate-dependent acetolactate synthase large subunit-like protein
MGFQQLPPADVFIAASADATVQDLLDVLGPGRRDPWHASLIKAAAIDQSRISVPLVASILRAAFDDPDQVTLACVCRNWPCDVWPFHDPMAYHGKDGGGGIGSMPSIAVGVALAAHARGRQTVAIIGDGDFIMGGHALWTAVRHRIPLLVLINNNRSYFNDELHQESIARRRGRPVQNRWIGQRLSDPEMDLAKFAQMQGATGIGPIRAAQDVKPAIDEGVAVLKSGGVCLIDLHIDPGQERTAHSSVGRRNL